MFGVRSAAVAALVLLSAAPAGAASFAQPISPVSYDAPVGNQGAYTYFDDGYTGTSDGARLTGGLGQLTDGIVATSHWHENAQPYVGWLNIDPALTFHFDAGTRFTGLTLYFDDAHGAGGVYLPSAVTATINGVAYAGTIGSNEAATPVSFSFGGAVSDSVDIAITRGASWTMLSEASFTGTAAPVPEPAEWAMMGLGLTITTALARRRRNRA